MHADSSRWQKYLELFSSATSEWSLLDGDFEGCAHLTPVIASDLAPWRERGGVRWEEFEAAKEQLPTSLVHYQIINHTLYRQQSCLFESRWV